MATSAAQKTATPASRRTIASYATYPEAGHAVDWLADHGFAVERSVIVGMGVRSVEHVTGPITEERAAKVGAAQGALMGALFAVLFGTFFTGPEFAELLVFSLAVGGVIGALSGVLTQYAASGGQPDFASTATIEADRYDLQVDTDAAEEAQRTLGAMAAHADNREKEAGDG